MTRFISFTAAAVFILVLWVLTLWTPKVTIDPAIWNQYAMTELRGH